MVLSRRHLLKSAYAAGLSYSTLPLIGSAHAYTANKRLPLVTDPQGMLDLPEGFSYTVVSETGGKMSDGFFRPGRPDGMACFAHPSDAAKCILMRNHENWPDTEGGSPFGDEDELLGQLQDGKLYDRKLDGRPFFGGVTTVVYDLRNKRIEREFLSLTGTAGNCAGGATPWGSWLSCEESSVRAPGEAQKDHGYVFEVPIDANGPVDPVPLTAMGRFAHEAAAVDLDTDIIYLTEDNPNGLFYRFLPNEKQNLSKGGVLQALVIKGHPGLNTSNWPQDWGGDGYTAVKPGKSFEVEWINLDDVEARESGLAERGHAAGAAKFYRSEGIAYGKRKGEKASVFFNCTQGGAARCGQVWRYTPSEHEGQPSEKDQPGELELIYESKTPDKLDLCDNVAFAPWGDLILCEDGFNEQYLRGLTPKGEIYDIAHNANERDSEFCGACFSPDGSILFVNVQEPGVTFAIEGPWGKLRG